MTKASIHSDFAVFRDKLETFRREADEHGLRAHGALGVGILMGGGFPGTAAALAMLLERNYPVEDWPWADPPK
jgi:hypothetical protein